MVSKQNNQPFWLLSSYFFVGFNKCFIFFNKLLFIWVFYAAEKISISKRGLVFFYYLCTDSIVSSSHWVATGFDENLLRRPITLFWEICVFLYPSHKVNTYLLIHICTYLVFLYLFIFYFCFFWVFICIQIKHIHAQQSWYHNVRLCLCISWVRLGPKLIMCFYVVYF